MGDRRGFLKQLGGAAMGASAAALLGNKAQAQSPSQVITCPKCSHTFEIGSGKTSGKMTPESLYELVKPPVGNFTSFTSPIALGNADNFDSPNRNNPNAAKKEKPNKSFLNSSIYRMPDIAPKYTAQLKKDFIDIAKGSQNTQISDSIKDFLNNKNIEINLEFIKYRILKNNSDFYQALTSQFADSKGFAATHGEYRILDNNDHHAKEDAELLINILKKETNDDQFDPQFHLAKEELSSNIGAMARKYKQLAQNAFSNYRKIIDKK